MRNHPHRVIAAALLAGAASLLMSPDGRAEQEQKATTFEVTIEGIGILDGLTLPDGSHQSAPISPGLYLVSPLPAALFQAGSSAAGTGLEVLAETGNAAPWIAEINAATVKSAAPFIHDLSFTFTARPGDRLFFAAMFVQSNDLYYAPGPEGIALFDQSGQPLFGDVSGQVQLWDAGTEVNEQPGLGPNQAPRQATPSSGLAENGMVRIVADGFVYPASRDIIRVTIALR